MTPARLRLALDGEFHGWRCISTAPHTQHVIPVGDTYRHALGSNCWCEPVLDDEFEKRPIFIHNAADDRDSFSQGYRLTS